MRYNEIYSDEQLWDKASKGDADAEEALIKRYSKIVRMRARPLFLMGGDSEDLIQEGMLGLLSAVRNYDPRKDALFRTYAEHCIRNRMYLAVKNAARMKHTPLNNSVSIQSPHFDESKTMSDVYSRDPEELIITRERIEEITGNKDGCLSKFESRVLGLYLEGKSYDEIAAETGKSAKSIDNAVQRIRKKVAQPN